MRKLKLFGAEFDVAPDGRVGRTALPPGVEGTWNVTLVSNRVDLQVDLLLHGVHRFVAKLGISVVETSAGVFCPALGEHPQDSLNRVWLLEASTPDPVGDLVVDVGSALFSLDAFQPDSVVGVPGEGPNRLAFRLGIVRTDSIALDPMPISVRGGRGTWTLRLDAPVARWEVGHAAFSCETATLANAYVTGEPIHWPGHQRRFVSVAPDHPIRLDSAVTWWDRFRFVLDDSTTQNTLVPLHTDPDGGGEWIDQQNPLVAQMALNAPAFRLAFAPRPAGSNARARLARASFVPPPVDPRMSLLSFAYADGLNKVKQWRYAAWIDDTDDGVLLNVRPFTSAKTGTLLLATNAQKGARFAVGPGGESSGGAAGAGGVHGFVGLSRFHLEHGARIAPVSGAASRVPHTGHIPEEIEAGIAAGLTLPSLALERAVLEHARPGRSYALSTDNPQTPRRLSTYMFGSQAGEHIPLLSDKAFALNQGTIRDEFKKKLDSTLADMTYDLQKADHETFMKEAPASADRRVKPSRVFVPRENADHISTSLHRVRRLFGTIGVEFHVHPDAPTDYFVIKHGGGSAFPNPFGQFLDATGQSKGGAHAIRTSGPPSENPVPPQTDQDLPKKTPRGVIKLSRSVSLLHILEKECGFTKDELARVRKTVDPDILEPGWVGLILFQLDLDIEAFEVFESIAPDKLRLTYLAVTPPPEGDDGTDPNFTGRALWYNPKAGVGYDPDTGTERDEVGFQVERIDVRWRNSRLTLFDVDAKAEFRSALGLHHDPNDQRVLKIKGSLDRESDKVRFIGELDRELELLPATGFGPIKQLSLRRAELRREKVATRDGDTGQTRTVIDLDGNIQLQEFDAFGLGVESIRFDALQVLLERPGSGDRDLPWPVSINYPSFRFKLKERSFRIGMFEMGLRSIGVSWPDGPDFGRWLESLSAITLMSKSTPTPSSSGTFLEFRLGLMKLPELAIISVDRLIIDLFVGLGLDDGGWSPDRLTLGLRGFSMKGLSLDLMRFLTLKIEHAELEDVTVNRRKTTWLRMKDVELAILGKTLLNDLRIDFFSTEDGEKGFLAYLPLPKTDSSLAIHWVLIGYNVSLPEDLAREVVAIDAPEDQGTVKDRLAEAIDKHELIPSPGDGIGSWTFAAGFDLFGMFVGKFLFQDRRYYGLLLRDGFLKEWFGLDIAISVLYAKGRVPDEDAWYVSVRVPAVTLPAVRFMGGVISIEIMMNGGFTLDVGFPWLPSNRPRRWDRSFGAIATPFQGVAGMYIRKRTLTRELEQGKYLQLAGGYALQVGLGAAFGNGVFSAWVSIGVYAILEGDFVFQRRHGDSGLGEVAGFRIVGAVGVIARGGGELNWWIISVRVEIMISAEARVTVLWGKQVRTLPGGSHRVEDGPDPALLRLDFELWASASARACIGKGWFKLCKSISVRIPMRVRYELPL